MLKSKYIISTHAGYHLVISYNKPQVNICIDDLIKGQYVGTKALQLRMISQPVI